jgi:Ca-activated chloride channel family protein
LQESDFQRKTLNLVIVMDISGSMNEEYNRYYYDNLGQLKDIYQTEGISRAKKVDSAREAVASILAQLADGDRFAIVTFNSNAFLFQSMTPVGETDMRKVTNRVYDIIAGGSTNLDAGLELATRQFRSLYGLNSNEYENRIIVLTDAQPNTGDYSSGGLLGTMESNAQQRIYTTFVGVGVDFNTQLIEQITKIKGANYYSVHSPGDFRERIQDEFDYMVTPLVFDLRLYFEADGWRIAEVFGSPEADEATGELMKVNTMFPSKSEGGETKGGLVLLKLQRTYGNASPVVYLKASYEDRNGRYDTSEAVVYLDTQQPEYFDNNGIRKGVLLARYACLIKNWLIDERQHLHISYPWEPVVREDTGIIIPPEPGLSEWERQSVPLTVSPAYRELFREFGDYFRQEMKAVDDYTLDQELTILNKISR